VLFAYFATSPRRERQEQFISLFHSTYYQRHLFEEHDEHHTGYSSTITRLSISYSEWWIERNERSSKARSPRTIPNRVNLISKKKGASNGPFTSSNARQKSTNQESIPPHEFDNNSPIQSQGATRCASPLPSFFFSLATPSLATSGIAG
jgi:hypothetical protein